MLSQAERVVLPDGPDAMEDIRDEVNRVKARINIAAERDSESEGPTDDSDKRALEIARNARFKGDDEMALQALEARFAKEPNELILRGLASVTYELAERSGDPALIASSVERAKQLLGFIDKAKDPSGWATACIMIGNAVDLASMSSADEADAKAAIPYYEGAIELLPAGHPERVHALNNMAVAYARAGDMNENAEDLEKAIALCEELLTSTSDRSDVDISYVMLNKATAYLSLGEMRDDTNNLSEAIKYAREALKLSPEHNKSQKSRIMMTLASGLALLGRVSKDPILLKESLDIHSKAKNIDTLTGPDLIGAQLNRAHTMLELGRQTDDLAIINQSIEIYQSCVASFDNLDLEYQTSISQRGLEIAKDVLKSMTA
jgi:tetratricopeptide (TPR) repeat protein